MPESLQDAFDELIPGAAGKATLFLKVIQQRAAEENVGLEFVPMDAGSAGQMVLQAKVRFGGMFAKGVPMTVVVHADPVGSSLQVGWQVTEEELNSVAALSQANQMVHANRQLRNLKPENQRKLSGMLKAFHLTVFMPTLHQLVEAIEASERLQGGSGFLGA